MIVENPRTQPHYLTEFFPIRPRLIDKDRNKNGDHFEKPTQYWFLNSEPEGNVTMEPINYVKKEIVDCANLMDGDVKRQIKRSMIHPQYASRFIKQYIIDYETDIANVLKGVSE